ncbi:MAG TPA: C1 family peptidase, partial [Pseudomonadales bacterium]
RSLGKTLDARPDRLDLRDREFAPLVVSLPARFPDDATVRTLLPAYVRAGLILSQGNEGACTGFGLACVVNYLFWRKALASGHAKKTKVEHVSTRMLYHLARFYDEWPGEDYDGSSCRGALKGWNKHGVCAESLWPYRDSRGHVRFINPKTGWDTDAQQRQLGVYYRIAQTSIVDMQAAIYQQGAIYVSSDVHDGWDVESKARSIKGHDSLPVIGEIVDRESIGGHAYALVGYNERGFVVQNSWDTVWGLDGFATLPYREWLRYGSDAWVCAIGVPGNIAPVATARTGQPQARLVQSAGVAFAAARKTTRAVVSVAVAPWTTDAAYRHSVVMDNDGRVVSRIVAHENAAAGVHDLVTTAPAAWLKRAGPAKRLMIYAHGGLNDEQGSIGRIRVLAPYFAANDIYPLFLTWRTGAIETLQHIIDDELKRVPRPDAGVGDLFDRIKETVVDALDRTIEVATRPVIKPIWSQMKQNAEASIEDGHGGALIATALL